MSDGSDHRPRRRRRLFLIGLVIALVPMTTAPHRESTCETGGSFAGSLLCTPIELIRLFGPVARYFLPSGR